MRYLLNWNLFHVGCDKYTQEIFHETRTVSFRKPNIGFTCHPPSEKHVASLQTRGGPGKITIKNMEIGLDR